MWNAVDSLYTRSDRDSLTLPYVQSPMIAADRAICRATGRRAWCARAEQLAERALVRFTTTVDMGPQFDAVYLRWMLALYAEDHDPRCTGSRGRTPSAPSATPATRGRGARAPGTVHR
jgi:hypothetical protein